MFRILFIAHENQSDNKRKNINKNWILKIKFKKLNWFCKF